MLSPTSFKPYATMNLWNVVEARLLKLGYKNSKRGWNVTEEDLQKHNEEAYQEFKSRINEYEKNI